MTFYEEALFNGSDVDKASKANPKRLCQPSPMVTPTEFVLGLIDDNPFNVFVIAANCVFDQGECHQVLSVSSDLCVGLEISKPFTVIPLNKNLEVARTYGEYYSLGDIFVPNDPEVSAKLIDRVSRIDVRPGNLIGLPNRQGVVGPSELKLVVSVANDGAIFVLNAVVFEQRLVHRVHQTKLNGPKDLMVVKPFAYIDRHMFAVDMSYPFDKPSYVPFQSVNPIDTGIPFIRDCARSDKGALFARHIYGVGRNPKSPLNQLIVGATHPTPSS